MSYIFGISIGIICITLSLRSLGQTYVTYIDEVALLMVVGGTISVAVASLPWQNIKEFFKSLFSMAFGSFSRHPTVILEGLRFVRERSYTLASSPIRNSIAAEVLKDGSEMIALNFSTEEISTILEERLHQYVQRKKEVANYFLRLAKYPPALGLVGTVFGLINLMRSITGGMSPAETGIKMSLALVATLYGLLVSNFIIFPIGESLVKRNTMEKFHGEIALQAVLLAADRVSLLKAQEMLNSFVTRSQRVDVIPSLAESQAA